MRSRTTRQTFPDSRLDRSESKVEGEADDEQQEQPGEDSGDADNGFHGQAAEVLRTPDPWYCGVFERSGRTHRISATYQPGWLPARRVQCKQLPGRRMIRYRARGGRNRRTPEGKLVLWARLDPHGFRRCPLKTVHQFHHQSGRGAMIPKNAGRQAPKGGWSRGPQIRFTALLNSIRSEPPGLRSWMTLVQQGAMAPTAGRSSMPSNGFKPHVGHCNLSDERLPDRTSTSPRSRCSSARAVAFPRHRENVL